MKYFWFIILIAYLGLCVYNSLNPGCFEDIDLNYIGQTLRTML